MLRNFFIFLFLSFTIAGVSAQQTLIKEIISDGISRSYTIYIPSTYSPESSVPLVISMHGFTSNMTQQLQLSDFSALSETNKFIVVYPQGSPSAGGLLTWNVSEDATGAKDIEFISNLIDIISRDYNIDAKRVYATGMSMGGFMSYALACNLPYKIAAIASVTGSMLISQYESCNPGRVIPVMDIHGTADPVVGYDGAGAGQIPIDTLIKFWVDNNKCLTNPEVDNLPNINILDKSTVVHYGYTDDVGHTTVEFYKIIGGGHTWPGSSVFLPFEFIVGPTNFDFSASVEIWRFFSQFTLDGIQSVDSQISKANGFNFSPNPTRGTFRIDGIDEPIEMIQLHNLSGEIILQQSDQTIDLSTQKSGIYLISVYTKKSISTRKIIKI